MCPSMKENKFLGEKNRMQKNKVEVHGIASFKGSTINIARATVLP